MIKQPLIEHYDFGEIVVGGREYNRDIVIHPEGVLSDWWRVEGHRLQLVDVRDFLGIKVDVVIIGTGYDGFMRVDDDVIETFKKSGAEVYVLKSRRAVSKYNEEVSKGRRVLLFIHLTC
ncbi:MAG: Mth938-like domain-containing protein [Desulfurococcaceae archaeon TW002]